jgi:quinol monooxygenase YgiN
MPALMIRTELAVHDGAVEKFFDVLAPWVDATKREVGTVGYHAFFDPETRTAILLEHYADDEAFLAHRAAIDPALRTRLYESCSLSGFELYGDPGPEVAGLLASARTFGLARSK